MSPVVRALRPVAVVVRLVVPPLILAAGLWAGWTLFTSRPAPELAPVPESGVGVGVVVGVWRGKIECRVLYEYIYIYIYIYIYRRRHFYKVCIIR